MFNRYKFLSAVLLSSGIGLVITAPAQSQGSPLPGGAPFPGGSQSYGSPVPTGRANYDDSSAPLPGTRPVQSSPVSAHPAGGPAGNHAAQARRADNLYSSLPISAEDARIRLEDLSNRLAVSRPDEVKDGIYTLSEWLQDMADAHWRMFKAFEKSDATKVQANKEKDIALKFSALKNRAKLLKADLLIKQNRYPEAIQPLVEIVTAEPTSQNGQDAYKRLVDMGFSEQIPGTELAEKAGSKH